VKKSTYSVAGRSCSLPETAIENRIAKVCSQPLNEGVQAAKGSFYNPLLYGISVTEFGDGKKANPTIALIDWHNPANNSFVFTEEFTVARSGGVENRRPDIVCFVNGIPLVVIEAKRPAGNAKKGPTIDEGISQSLRNQRHDEIPLLFAYSQLLLSVNGTDGRYGTCGTPAKFWATWREEDISDADMYAIKNRSLSDSDLAGLFDYRPAA